MGAPAPLAAPGALRPASPDAAPVPLAVLAAASSRPTAAASGRACGSRLQQGLDHGTQRARRPGARRFGVGDGRQDRDRVTPIVERPPPLHRGVQGRAQRPQIRGRAGRIAPDPFRSREPGGSHHHPGLGQAAVAFEGGDAEVGQHGPAVGPEQHVARLHVAMQDAGRVSTGQRAEHPGAQVGGLMRAQRPVLGEDLVQGPCLDQFHHDPRTAVRLDDVEDGHHRGMVEPRRGAGLAQGALVEDPGFLGHHRARGHRATEPHLFDRDVTVQDGVPGSPDGAHGPAADGAVQEVAPRDHPPRAGRNVHDKGRYTRDPPGFL